MLPTLAILPAILALPIASQPRAKQPYTNDELRELNWGELNVIHTTDTHGWLAGHLLEREFSGDWGDFYSFQSHMRELANKNGRDVLLVDSGDRHDGNGLSDASKHDGSLSLPIFCEINYDVVTVGNHELYRGVASLQEFKEIRSKFGERYVVSNVDIRSDNGDFVPMGEKYRWFRTEVNNLRVLAFGFLFNFEGNDKSITKVTKVEDEVQKQWFADVASNELKEADVVLVAGHIPLRGSAEFEVILQKIRETRSDVPVLFLGGHSHIRDFRQFDRNSAGIQSGRFVETVGFLSTNFSSSEETSFARSYIDFNKRNFAFHANKSLSNFDTEHGISVSNRIAVAREKLDLDHFRAHVPKTYYVDRAPYMSENSIYRLLQQNVLPLLESPPSIAETTRYIIVNTGAIRFDLFKGNYTKDTGYILSPFKNEWFCIRNVPREVADKLLPIINNENQVFKQLGLPSHAYADQTSEVDDPTEDLNTDLFTNILDRLVPRKWRSAGYRTRDDYGTTGDDVVHEPWKFYPVPQAFQSILEGSKPSPNVTLVYQTYVGWFIERALQQLDRPDLYKPEEHGGEQIVDLVPRYFATT